MSTKGYFLFRGYRVAALLAEAGDENEHHVLQPLDEDEMIAFVGGPDRFRYHGAGWQVLTGEGSNREWFYPQYGDYVVRLEDGRVYTVHEEDFAREAEPLMIVGEWPPEAYESDYYRPVFPAPKPKE